MTDLQYQLQVSKQSSTQMLSEFFPFLFSFLSVQNLGAHALHINLKYGT